MAKFKTRARAVDMLGRQQIAGIPTAISELFKNAHDAYADKVEIDFYRKDRLFVLRDDGTGMTLDEFENRWLAVGTESKLKSSAMEPLYIPHNKKLRPMLGEKGIGRLSIAVIGSQLLVMTRARRRRLYPLVVAYIHWGVFECPGLNLDEIEIPTREFPNGSLPTFKDIQEMLEEFSSSLKSNPRIPQDMLTKILKDIKIFKVDPVEIDGYLKNNDSLTLKGDGHGTHFIIMPATELLIQDIDATSNVHASPLEKALCGFTNTMIPEHEPPAIITAFRDFKTDTVYDELIDKDKFFSPEEFSNADHTIIGEFDEYGQFKGNVTIYGELYKDHVIPWSGGHGLLLAVVHLRFLLPVFKAFKMNPLSPIMNIFN